MSNILLSICIPTFNRADILNRTLEALFSDPDFDQKSVEVIVSDNCSLDHTEEVVKKFPLVQYYRNEENIRDANFTRILGYASGKYIRLFNDTLTFKPGILKEMLKKIDEHMFTGENLFFYQNMFLNTNTKKTVSDKEEFLGEVSYFNTWIANFGVWKDTFLVIENKNKYSSMQLLQVNWSLQIAGNGKKTIIYYNDLFYVDTPPKKGDYNIFSVFVSNYLYILKDNSVGLLSMELEKFRLFRYFIFPWLVTLFVKNKEGYGFSTNGGLNIIMKNYWYHLYIYLFFLVLIAMKCLNVGKKESLAS